MSKNNMENIRKFMSGKGYYIALVLCAVAIGISGYLYYRTANANDQKPSNQEQAAAATKGNQDVPVFAQPTQPGTTVPSGTKPQQGQQATTPQPGKPAKTVSPLKGETVGSYAVDCLSYNPTTRDWRVHNGVDIAAVAGSQVCAAAAGEVSQVYEDDRMGFTVVIAHQGGYETTYSSLSKNVSVKAGDKVTAGQVIGTVGNSALVESAVGDHLHFSVKCNGKDVNPADFLK